MPESLPPGPVTIAPRRLHPLSPILSGGIALVRSWPLVLIAAARSSWALVVGLAVALVVWRTMEWFRTTWALDANGLVVRSGLFQRTVQTVPPQRVQQVEVRRGLRHRSTGLAAVRVGLAGSGESSQVDLDALSSVDAEHLHAVLERWRTGPAPGDPLPPPSLDAAPPVAATELFRVETWHLVVAGLTSRTLWLAPLAAMAGLVQLLGDLRLDDEATGAVRSRLAEVTPALLIAAVMVVAVLAAVISTIVTNHGLAMTRLGDDLTVRRGLLEQRSVVVPRRRVQFVRLGTNVLRARAGLASLDARTADLGAAGDDSSSMSLPIGAREDLERVMGELLLTADPSTPVHRHPPAAVRREIIRRAVVLVPVSAVAGLLTGRVAALVSAVVGGLVLAIISGWIAGRRRRSGWSGTTVVTEWGFVAWRRVVVPVDRIQSVATVRSPTQRRAGLATLRLDVAGSRAGVELRDLAADDALTVVELFEAAGRPPVEDRMGNVWGPPRLSV